MNIYYVTMFITVYQTCHNKQPRMIFGIYSNIKFWDLLLINPDPIKLFAFNNLHNVQISFLSYCRWMMGVFITLNNILLGICFCTINAVTVGVFVVVSLCRWRVTGLWLSSLRLLLPWWTWCIGAWHCFWLPKTNLQPFALWTFLPLLQCCVFAVFCVMPKAATVET